MGSTVDDCWPNSPEIGLLLVPLLPLILLEVSSIPLKLPSCCLVLSDLKLDDEDEAQIDGPNGENVGFSDKIFNDPDRILDEGVELLLLNGGNGEAAEAELELCGLGENDCSINPADPV